MGVISPHGLRIPIFTITRSNILLIMWHVLLINFQGRNLIDVVLPIG